MLLVAAGPDVAVNLILGLPFIKATGMIVDFIITSAKPSINYATPSPSISGGPRNPYQFWVIAMQQETVSISPRLTNEVVDTVTEDERFLANDSAAPEGDGGGRSSIVLMDLGESSRATSNTVVYAAMRLADNQATEDERLLVNDRAGQEGDGGGWSLNVVVDSGKSRMATSTGSRGEEKSHRATSNSVVGMVNAFVDNHPKIERFENDRVAPEDKGGGQSLDSGDDDNDRGGNRSAKLPIRLVDTATAQAPILLGNLEMTQIVTPSVSQ